MDIGRDQQLIRVSKPKRDHSGIWVRVVVLGLIALALAFGYAAWTDSVAPTVSANEASVPSSSYAPPPATVDNVVAAPDQDDVAPADAGATPTGETPQ